MAGVVNALLVRWADGFVEVTDSASIGAWGRREGFLSLGRAPSATRATFEANKHLATLSSPREAITVATEPVGAADQPYTAYSVGDTVTAPDSAGVNQSRRVRSLTVTEDDEGNPYFIPGLAT